MVPIARIEWLHVPLRGAGEWSLDFDRWLSLARPVRRTDPMTGKRKRYSAELKARVALEALRRRAPSAARSRTACAASRLSRYDRRMSVQMAG